MLFSANELLKSTNRYNFHIKEFAHKNSSKITLKTFYFSHEFAHNSFYIYKRTQKGQKTLKKE